MTESKLGKYEFFPDDEFLKKLKEISVEQEEEEQFDQNTLSKIKKIAKGKSQRKVNVK